MTTKQILFRDSRLCYRTGGSGISVMLVHGFAEDSRIWNCQASFLAAQYRVILPDLPGSGASEILAHNNVSLEDYAAALMAVLSAENISEVILIGHSMGGYISLAFAAQYPQYLKAFGLFHSSAFADDEEKIGTRRKGIRVLEEKGSNTFLKTSVPGLFAEPGEHAALIDQMIRAPFSPAALIQYYKAMIAGPDRTAVLRSFKNPVLFVIGARDKVIHLDQSLRQSHLPTESHIHILRESAHMGMIEEAARSNQILAQFLHSL